MITLPTITLGGVSIIILIGILIGLLKKMGVPSRWLPLSSILAGLGLGTLAYFDGGLTLSTALVGGAIIGASVSGLYDLGKKTILGN